MYLGLLRDASCCLDVLLLPVVDLLASVRCCRSVVSLYSPLALVLLHGQHLLEPIKCLLGVITLKQACMLQDSSAPRCEAHNTGMPGMWITWIMCQPQHCCQLLLTL